MSFEGGCLGCDQVAELEVTAELASLAAAAVADRRRDPEPGIGIASVGGIGGVVGIGDPFVLVSSVGDTVFFPFPAELN